MPIIPSNAQPYRSYWSFSNAALNAVWATVQVPTDIVAATNISVYVWTERVYLYQSAATVMRWGFDAWVGSRAAVGVGSLLANQTGAASIAYPARTYAVMYEGAILMYQARHGRYAQRDLLGTIPVSAGDIIHTEIYRDPTHVDDVYAYNGALFMVEFAYTADN